MKEKALILLIIMEMKKSGELKKEVMLMIFFDEYVQTKTNALILHPILFI